MLQGVIPLLVALIVWLIIRHGRLAAIHPGAWYAVAWIACIVSYTISDYADAVPYHDDLQLEKLATYVIFSTVCFFVFSFLGKPGRTMETGVRVLWRPETWEKFTSWMLAGGLVGLIASIGNIILLGIGFTYSDATRQNWLNGIPTVTARLWYPYMATYPAAFVVGVRLSVCLLSWKRPTIALFATMILTLGSGYLWMVGTGGRQAFGIVILLCLVGVAFGWARGSARADSRLLWKVILGATLLCGIVSAFAFVIDTTGRIRAQNQGSQESKLSSIPGIGWGGQFFEYMGGPIATFQSYGAPRQRDLSDTGPVTFAAVQDLGVGYLFGWRRPDYLDTNPERAFAGTGFRLANGTRNIFYDMEADFGYNGEFVALFVLIAVSQIGFMTAANRRGIGLFGIAPLTMLLMFWGYSHQLSLLMSPMARWLFFSFGVWDLLVLFSNYLAKAPSQTVGHRIAFQENRV
jgi:hypothetical protein